MPRISLAAAAAAAAVVGSASAFPTWLSARDGYNGTTNSSTISDYTQLPPSPDLSWTPCFERFQCANLEVPLDYEEDVGTTNVAFIKLSGGDGEGQDILFNPGGPGASGVTTLLTGLGDDILKNFGGNYNLISFDPRGVNNSGPYPFSCFPTREARDQYALSSTPPSASLQVQYATAKALGEYCTETNRDKNVKYGGTLAVVQDMMHFHKLSTTLKGGDGDTEPIWYYGTSYGTVIGQTLAAAYPDRIGRVIVDGNVYGKQYYEGYITNDVDDSDQTFAFFFQYCFEAGPARCRFAGNSSSAHAIELRYLSLIQKLEDEPLIVTDTGLPQIITRYAFQNWAFNEMYQPMTGFPKVAYVAADLEQGNATSYLRATTKQTKSEESVATQPKFDEGASQEALGLITCVDANTRYPFSNFTAYEAAYKRTSRESLYAGDILGRGNLVMCAGFGVVPPASQLFTWPEQVITTAAPVLFIGNTGDPITPVSSALRMSPYFAGSAVLTQDSPGHCSLTSKSACTTGYIQNYLATGALPEPGTICEIDVKPFQDQPAARRH
ncbi:TAP-like protein-domain-containing protein [Lophiotrema nucula]|uniref:TAP-like protein-domain-containing protein n=1 Tax=Lophiotrema nucula TaxID=690887 RepID=A0A6A5YIF6_9PLEO|nr:TAP-like protein-domain-containing protein [Lophiotrema nucula]